MTQSLPARRSPSPFRLKFAAAASRLSLPLMARIPDPVKRLMLGRRSITIEGNTLDTTLQLMLNAQRLSGVDGLVASDDVDVARNQLDSVASALSAPVVVPVRDFTIPGPAGALPVRHYAAEPGAPLLVFFHGGGFVVGSLDTHEGLCRRICHDAGVHVLSVDYRLAPEHKAPAAGEDCLAAYRWSVEHVGELGADPRRIAVGGDSAGGNLAAVVTQAARDTGLALPILQLLIYPMVDPQGETVSRTLFADGYFLTKADIDWFNTHYIGGADISPTDVRVAPLRATDLSGLSPALVLTAGFDPLRDEGAAYGAALAAAGVPVDLREYGSLTHGFVNFFPLGGGSDVALTDLTSALRAHLSR
ncbi:lipase [Mycobacterium adipatum]|uniref:Lipase n=1 Tax=Mycobacterium adipatum TaxID=1682113 RepID=A0A172UQK8_9MYCO|nr:alpha/beta hydrolase [Mycobacterium adipatum]ANE81293.1 lipase [Mycobacterium adipatum]